MKDLLELSKKYRIELFEKFLEVKQGHPGSVFSIIDLMTFLFFANYVKFDLKNKILRDLLVVSKGHATVTCYPMLRDIGILSAKEWDNWTSENKKSCLRVFGNNSIPGIQVATGSLGHGVGIGTGRSIIAKQESDEKFKSWIIISEGELYEGSTWEAALLASHNDLDNLIVIVDVNNLIILGSTQDCISLGDIDKKFESFGFDTSKANGHNFKSLENSMKIVEKKNGKPKAILIETIKGKGIKLWENKPHWHYWNEMSKEDIEAARKDLNGST